MDNLNAIGQAHLNAKIEVLIDLLGEIKDFETMHQVRGMIHGNIELLEKVKKDRDYE